jgi:hypothetical protein
MTDEQILDRVYKMLSEKECGFSREMREVQSFIEQEWQKQDDSYLPQLNKEAREYYED